MTEWTRDYFERGYAQRWGLLPPSDSVRLDAANLGALLRIGPASRVIDIGCGHGRHALALAELGAEVIGIDTAIALLDRAQHFAAQLQRETRWIRGDMRRLPIQSRCASAAILMDAFGFFETDEEHEAVLREAARVLTTGGRLVLKIVNGGVVLGEFRPTDREERDGTVVTIARTLTFEPARITERIRVSGRRGDGEYERRQRLYRVEELGAVLERAGFEVVDVYAALDGTPFEPAVSPTMWFVCQRCASDRVWPETRRIEARS